MFPKGSNSYAAIFNSAKSSVPCGNSSEVSLKGFAQLGSQVNYLFNNFEKKLSQFLNHFFSKYLGLIKH